MNILQVITVTLAGICLMILPGLLYSDASAQTPCELAIESSYDVVPGHTATLGVVFNGGGEEIDAFDLRVVCNGEDLHFIGARPGAFYARCGWEYFSYRFLSTEAPGAETIHFVGAVSASGEESCYLPGDGETLFSILVATNPGCEYRCRQLAVRFYWASCGDNTITLRATGDRIVSRFVYDYDDAEITDNSSSLPGPHGAPDICLDPDSGGGERAIDFRNGAVYATCSDDICINRGDINCNSIPYEVSDAVLLSRYFILTPNSSFVPIEICSVDNTDVNADGIALSVADFVYLVRVIIHDVMPYPKPTTLPDHISLTMGREAGGMSVYCESGVDVGAVLLEFTVDEIAGSPELGSDAADMEMESGSHGNRMRVFLYDIGSARIPAGKRHLLTIPTSSISLIEAEAADYRGRPLTAAISESPAEFGLSSSYPNPFRSATEISLWLPQASDWTLTVYNITGQVVRNFAGHNETGLVHLTWDGRDIAGVPVAAGIYFYKATVDGRSQTRKMILIK